MQRQKILMCPPHFFAVDYVINPWMENNKGLTDQNLAAQQWRQLRSKLAEHADIVVMDPQPGLPDMVFTANAGLVLKKIAVVSRFTSPERQGEEPFFKEWFEANGFDVAPWPQDVPFEGAGDSLFHRGKDLLWQGYGFRSDVRSVALLEKILNRRVIGLHLVDSRFYHLDTCFCPLPDGYVMYFPEAFDAPSRALIEAEVPEEKRIIVREADAVMFACNMVEIEGVVYINNASTLLKDDLRKAGFTPVVTSLSEFMKAGGAAKCLTLKLFED